MANTTNFGWETPDDTDLVKDGALAMRTLGNAIDTSLVDLKGGTTGQVLSKNTNTDMDFTWVTPNDADAIQNSIVDAKGDLISATADNSPARLASSGVNGNVLTVDTSTATGLKWAAPASGGGFTLINTGGTALNGASTSVTSIPGTYRNLHIYIDNFYMGTDNENGRLQINSTNSDNYAFMGLRRSGGGAEATATEGNNDVGIYFSSVGGTTAQGAFAYLMIPNYAATTHRKTVMGVSYTKNDGTPGDYYVMQVFGVLQNSSSAVTSIQVTSNGTYAGGTVYVYGEA